MSSQMKMIVSEVEDAVRSRLEVSDGGVTYPDLHLPIGGDDRQDACWLRDYFRRVIRERISQGRLSWIDVLRMRFLELAAEPDRNWPTQRQMAIQLAAEAVAMVEAGDIRASTQKAQDQGGDSQGQVQSS